MPKLSLTTKPVKELVDMYTKGAIAIPEILLRAEINGGERLE